MSTGDVSRRRAVLRPGVRIGLLGLAFGAAWLAVSLFAGAQDASAATATDPSDDGLRGLLGATTQTVSTVVESTAAPLQPVVRSVDDAVGSVADPVARTVGQIVDAVAGTPQAPGSPDPLAEGADSAPRAVGAVAASAAEAVGVVPEIGAAVPVVVTALPEVLGAVELADVVNPVTELVDDVVVGVVGDVPIVGGVVTSVFGQTPASDLLGPTVDAIDRLVDRVAGVAAVGPQAPDAEGGPPAVVSAPVTGTRVDSDAGPPPTAVPADGSAPAWLPETISAALLVGTASRSGGPQGSRVPAPLSMTPGPGASAGPSGAPGASASMETTRAALVHDVRASRALPAISDELPSSLMSDTDSTPD